MTEYGKNALLSYNQYLKVPELIGLQETLSDPVSHDELLFIVIHQTYELWFKQILHEIDATRGWHCRHALWFAEASARNPSTTCSPKLTCERRSSTPFSRPVLASRL